MALIRDSEEEERDEAETAACSDCGAGVYAADRSYGFGSDQLLCWLCAERRGGRYDARQERWIEAPELGDLRPRDQRER
jgi:hypothetical protein